MRLRQDWVLNSNNNCVEVGIEGDCVWRIFDAQYKNQIDNIFATAFSISSLIDILNFKLSKINIQEVRIGVGLSFGRVLMIKAGYNGSGINDVVWMGDVVNEAAKLCGYGNKEIWTDQEIMASGDFYYNLSDYNKSLLTYNYSRSCYHGNVINVEMNKWLEEEKAKDKIKDYLKLFAA